ncbi:hypothetical protein GGH16_001494, partial [Coemansia sp. RSA 560]
PVALHRWLDEIAPTLAGVLLVAEARTDDAWVAVRRACAVFWADLCTGYGDRLLELCDTNMLRDVYKTLKNLEAADPDEIVRLQAQSGIALIDATVRVHPAATWAGVWWPLIARDAAASMPTNPSTHVPSNA